MEGRKPTGVHSIVTPGDATDGSGGGDSDDDRNADADGELSSPQPRSGPAAAPSAPTGSRAPPTQASSTNPPKKVHVGPNDDDDDLFDIDAMIEEDDLERRRQENASKASAPASGKSPAKAIVVDDDDDELWAGMMDIDDLAAIDLNPNQGKTGADKGKGKVVDEVEDEEMWDVLRDMEGQSGGANNDSNTSRKEGVPPTRASMPVDGEGPALSLAGGNAAKVVVDDPGDWDDMYFND